MVIKRFSSVFSFALLFSAQSFNASYIDLSATRSNLAQVIADVSAWDEDQNSPLWQFNKYMQEGNATALKDAVVETLAYAESVIGKKSMQLSHDQLDQINNELNILADAINSGDLSATDDADMARSNTFKVKEKAKFYKDVEFQDKADFKHFVGFHGNVHFWKNVEIDGTLSVNNAVISTLSVTDLIAANCINTLCVNSFSVGDQVIGCDLSVGCNISMVDSVDAGHGNIIKNGNPFITTFPGSTSENTFVGENAGNFSVTGTNNSAFGNGALVSLTDGIQNTAIGNNALNNNVTGNGNIGLGYNAGTTLLTGDNNVYIAAEGAPAESGTIRIGTDLVHTLTYIQGIWNGPVTVGNLPVLVDLNGHLGTVPSGKRFKQNISDMDIESEGIYSLRPVTFSYKSDESNTKEYGLIAEEVAEIFPTLIAYNRDGEIYSVRYQVLPMLLLNEVQKQHASIEALTARVAQLEQA